MAKNKKNRGLLLIFLFMVSTVVIISGFFFRNRNYKEIYPLLYLPAIGDLSTWKWFDESGIAMVDYEGKRR